MRFFLTLLSVSALARQRMGQVVCGLLLGGALGCRPAAQQELRIPPLPAGDADVLGTSLASLNDFIDDDPRNSAYRYRRAVLYEQSRRYAEALQDVNRAIEYRRTDDAYGRYYVLRGRIHLYRNRIDSAYSDAVQSEKLGVQSAAAYLLRGQLYTLRREYGKAAAALQAVRQLTPHDPQVYYWQANATAGRGDTARAQALLHTALKARPEYVQAYNRLAELHAGQHDIATAKRYAFAGLRLDSGNVYLNNTLGRIYRRTNDPDSALGCYLRSLHRDTAQHLLRYEVGLLYLERKAYREAIPYLETLVTRAKRYPNVPDLLAVCYDRTGQERSRLEAWQAHLAVDSTDTNTQRLYAALNRRLQQRRRQNSLDSIALRRRQLMNITPVEIRKQ